MEVAELVKIFQTKSEPKTFASQEIIFKEGEQGHTMYGIISGEVELVIDGHVVETIKAGDIFGEGALVDKEHTRASTAIAKTECQLTYINEPTFVYMVQETPMFALDVIRSYSVRLRRLKRTL